jgi:hypothetical protein
MTKNKKYIIEKALICNFKDAPAPEIPKEWRSELRQKIYEFDPKEEMLFIKYEKSFWRMAWISFAASIFIFISLMYLSNRENSSLKQTVTRKIYEYLTMEHEL